MRNHDNTFDRVLSLGVGCQVAYQINRHFGKSETGFFDWIITNHQALMSVLSSNFRHVLSGEVPIADARRVSVLDSATGLFFYTHDLPISEDGRIIDSYLTSIPELCEKYTRRAHRFMKAIASERVLLIRHTFDLNVEEGEVREVHDFFSGFPNASILWTTSSPEVLERFPNFSFITPTAIWTGDDQSWSRLFSGYNIARQRKAG